MGGRIASDDLGLAKSFKLGGRVRHKGKVEMVRSLLTPTALLSKPRTRTELADRTATRIGRFLREQHLGAKRRAQHFSQLLLAYLGNRYTEVEAMIDSLEERKSSHDAAERMPVQYTCLLCSAVFPYRGNLTRHDQNVHYIRGRGHLAVLSRAPSATIWAERGTWWKGLSNGAITWSGATASWTGQQGGVGGLAVAIRIEDLDCAQSRIRKRIWPATR
jgi:hypothetical protein